MSSVNKVTLLGHLGRDPEVRAFQNGGRVCNLAVATSEKWRDKQSGEMRENTQWHRVAIFAENLVGIAEKYLRKGSKVYLEGKLETRKVPDQNGGSDRYFTEVVLRPYAGEIVLLDRPQQEGQQQPQQGGQGGYGNDPGRAPAPGQGGSQPPSGGAQDEIPF